MTQKYTIRSYGHSIEITKPNSTILIYRIPYQELKENKQAINIQNNFIVYILLGKNNNGKDIVYVGKSKNGIRNRPTSHEDKYNNWNVCYILTQYKERTFFNDGTIQYLEDKISNRINKTNTYKNTTQTTTQGTANDNDQEDCDDYLKQSYEMLYIIGLNLLEKQEFPSKNLINTDIHEQINESMMPLYIKLDNLLQNMKQNLTIKPQKHYINYMLNKEYILNIESQQKTLFINFNMKKGTLKDPQNKLRDMSNIGHHGGGDYRLTITDETEFKYIEYLTKEVIKYKTKK